LLESIYSEEEYQWFIKHVNNREDVENNKRINDANAVHHQHDHNNILVSSPYRFLHRELIQIQIPCAAMILQTIQLYSYYHIHLLFSEELMSRGGKRYTSFYTMYDTIESNLDYISLSIEITAILSIIRHCILPTLLSIVSLRETTIRTICATSLSL
jgi:hypothetical protein